MGPAAVAGLNVSTLTPSQGFSIDGEQCCDAFADSAANIGDFNGDGFDDIAIGAADFMGPNFNSYSGRAYVLFGDSSGEFETDLALLDGTNGFAFSGETEYSYTGYSVAGAGDFNGDGLSDVVVGAPGVLNSSSSTLPGTTYVIFGGTSTNGDLSPTELSNANGANGLIIEGVTPGDIAGYSVSGGGDFNGDGLSDIIIGAPYVGDGGDEGGAAYVVFGDASSSSASVALDNLSDSDGLALFAPSAYQRMGTSVAFVGDINNDNIDDIALGAPTNTGIGSINKLSGAAGAVYVVFGSNVAGEIASDLQADVVNGDGSKGFRVDGEAAEDRFGDVVSPAEDINDDGVVDFVVIATEADYSSRTKAGKGYVVFGQDTAFSPILSTNNLGGTVTGFRLGGASPDGALSSAAPAGDVNGDGIDDLILGAVSADSLGGTTSGAAYVVFGSSSRGNGDIDLKLVDGIDGFEAYGQTNAGIGLAVSGVGDINQDGFSDVLVGQYPTSFGGSRRANILFGGLTGFGEIPEISVNSNNIDFDSVEVASSSQSLPLILTSSGSGPLSINSISLAGDHATDFDLAQDSCSNQQLPAGTDCQIDIVFQPADAGIRTAELSIASNAQTSPDSVTLSGSGVLLGTPSMSVESLDFGGIVLGEEGSIQTVDITNTGPGPLLVSQAIITGVHPDDFVILMDTCSGESLPVGDACTLSIQDALKDEGAREAKLNISTNGGNLVVSLNATGHQPALSGPPMTDEPPSKPPVPVPTLSRWLKLLLATSVGLSFVHALRAK